MAGNVVIFPGQGSQAVGMGKDVAGACPAAARVFEQADEILGFGLSGICFEGPAEELTRTDVQQPAIFVASVAIWEAMLELGASRERLLQTAAGLSLGEYTALYAAGSLTFEDGLRLVRRRGELMQEAATQTLGGMVSIIGGEESAVEALCSEAAGRETLVLANFNCPGQIVLSGHAAACDRAVELAGKHGVRAIKLNVAGAFHSPLMQAAADKLKGVLADTAMAVSQVPVYANVDAEIHGEASAVRGSLARQVTCAVRWRQTIEKLIDRGSDCFYEVGSGRVLTGLMRKINRKVQAVNVSTLEGVRAVAGASSE